MGLLSFITGLKKIITYNILFDKENNVTVNVIKRAPNLPKSEYIRFWAFYLAKAIFNIGYPNNFSIATLETFTYLEMIINNNGIDSKSNCLKKAGLDRKIKYSNRIWLQDIGFKGEYYCKGYYSKDSFYRNLQTHIPFKKNIDEKLIYSTIALMQYCINIIKDDTENLNILAKTAKNFFEFYKDNARLLMHKSMGMGPEYYIYFIPQIAYFDAIGVFPEELKE